VKFSVLLSSDYLRFAEHFHCYAVAVEEVYERFEKAMSTEEHDMLLDALAEALTGANPPKPLTVHPTSWAGCNRELNAASYRFNIVTAARYIVSRLK